MDTKMDTNIDIQPQSLPPGVPAPKPDEFTRMPGLFSRWELQQVVKPGPDFYLEEGGKLTDGTQLFAIYSRSPRGRRLP
jgi:hypothetical protein